MKQTFERLLQATTEKYPDAPALLDTHGRMLTYHALSSQVKAIRSQLLGCGLGRHARIALILPEGIEMALAILGVLSTASVAPLNARYRPNELSFYLEDLQASAVIVPGGDPFSIQGVAEGLDIPVLEMAWEAHEDAGWRLVGAPLGKFVNSEEVQEDDIALILHTSGTTARPKMVPLRQRNLFASAANICRTFQLAQPDRCLNVMPMFHIQGFMSCLLAPLMAGASIVCTEGFDAHQFFSWIERFQPSYYSASPTIHQAVIAGAAPYREVIQRHPLRFIRSSAAPLPPTVMRELEESMQAPVIESYGMTEGALQSTSNPLPPRMRKPGSVGPAAGPEVVILDQAGSILPNGSRGEVALRGANVIDGYLNNPQANCSAFVNGWFRTGDEGYLDEDLYLHITGRLKEMINRGGEKVTPREVDEIFLTHPAVLQAVTFAVPHPSLGEDVATAVVLRENSTVTEKELRQYALFRLSDLKAPSRVLILEALPKGSTGKLQRIGLYQELRAHFQAEYHEPRNEDEKKLVAIFQQLLSLPRVGIKNNFFNLGGDSLLAAGLSARVKEEMGANLSIEQIFRHPTVEEMAECIREQQKQGAASRKVPAMDEDVLDYLSKM